MSDDIELSKDWVKHVKDELIPMIDDSAYVMSLVPKADDVDVKFAVELGLSIMLDKPIIAIVHPGTPIPGKLKTVADYIITADISKDADRLQLVDKLEAILKDIDE